MIDVLLLAIIMLTVSFEIEYGCKDIESIFLHVSISGFICGICWLFFTAVCQVMWGI